MADAKKAEDKLSGILSFAVLIGVCLWVGMIVASKGETRLEQACKPVEFTTQALHQVTQALIGSQPTWTLYVQEYLMTGCYYFFKVIFTDRQTDSLSTGNIEGKAIN